MQAERRTHRRTKKQLTLDLHKTRLFFLRGPENSAEAADISTAGARINTRAALTDGDQVVLHIRRVESEPVVSICGKVVWTKSVAEGGHTFTQAGISFTRLGTKQRVLLVRLTTGL